VDDIDPHGLRRSVADLEGRRSLVSAARKFRRKKRVGFLGGPGGRYLPMVLRLIAETKIEPGSLGAIRVRHDHWCGIFAGRPCGCSPDVEMTWRDREGVR
jgi:hypothetical protein